MTAHTRPIERMNGYAPPVATLDYAKPLQVDRELEDLIAFLRLSNVRSYLEVGTRYGGTFERVMLESLPRGAKGIALDFPGGAFGDSESASILMAALARVRAAGRDVDCILGPSTAPEIVKRAAQHAPYDAILIDADHTYDAVKRDFELYAPMGKIIVLHDIAAPDGHTSRLGLPVEVPKFWREIKDSYRHIEFVAPGSVMGIGVLFRE